LFDGVFSLRRSRTAYFLFLFFFLMAWAVPGCTGDREGPPPEKSYVTVTGSDTMIHLAHRWAKTFTEIHPEIEVSIKGGGSEGGIEALIGGKTDICAASRKISDEEIVKAGEKNVSPREIVVAWDGLAVVTHPDNPVAVLTTDQLRKIFTGEITRWSEVGGGDAPITVLTREPDSGTYVFFQKHVLQTRAYTPAARQLPANSAIIQTVSTNTAAIGYVGLGYALAAEDEDQVKILAVQANETSSALRPAIQSVVSGKYLISRPLYFYVDGEPPEPVKTFIDFCLSTDGQIIVKKAGYVNARSTLSGQAMVTMTFLVVGGLGIFLLGMKNMSEGMQAVAGAKLRHMINAVTNNRLIAVGVGGLVTCLIQSSSVTTVMVVGMVNAGIMTLVQAIGVIIGANVGTTITGWILVLKIGKYGLPLLGVAAFFYLFAKRDRVRYTASMFLGLGMVFFGLELMKNGFAPLQDMEEFQEWFSRFTPDTYWGIIKCGLVGAVLTAVVQSSSATVGITIALVSIGVIDFRPAAALVLGVNIGTTITAFLAALGASTNAKRAAYAHTLMNFIGAIWVSLIFAWYVGVVERLVGMDPQTKMVLNPAKGVAVAHTIFNIANGLLFLPFTGHMSRLLHRLVPDRRKKEIPHLTYLNVRMLDTPALGIQQSYKEIIKMGQGVAKMLGFLREIIATQQPDKPKEEKIFNRENVLDIVQKEIVEYLGQVMAGNISHDVIDQTRRQLRMADEYESISDYITNILKLNLKIRDTDQRISEEGVAELLDLHDQVTNYIRFINEATEQENTDVLNKARTRGQAITHLMKKYRSLHLARVGNGVTTPLKSLMFTDMLNAYRRIKDHAFNIAEVLAGEK